MDCQHGVTRKIAFVYKQTRTVLLTPCGHTKQWPPTYINSLGCKRVLPMPEVGQVTSCHEGGCCPDCAGSNSRRVLTAYRRPGAEWNV